MSENTSNSQRQSSQPSRHYDSVCNACAKEYLAKAGRGCPYCGGSSKQGDEITRKTFGADDHDLKKAL